MLLGSIARRFGQSTPLEFQKPIWVALGGLKQGVSKNKIREEEFTDEILLSLTFFRPFKI